MVEKKFCPKTCDQKYTDAEWLCNPTSKTDRCWSSHSVEYDEPIPIEMIWYARVWIDALILGENQDDYIIQSDKSEGVTYINKKSPLLRKT